MSNEMIFNQGFFGTNPHKWIGVVENRADPLQLGRCQVRIHGYHTDDKSLIPTEHLPWAMPVMPITSAALSGVGESPTGPMEGTVVVGFWADYPDCQIPFMEGTINQIELINGSLSGGSGISQQTLHQPGNLINDGNFGPGTINPVGDGPRWLQIARGEMKKKVKEWPGSSHNPEVLKYGKDLGFTTDDREHPWCAAFARWCLKEAGVSVSGITGMAKSFLKAPSMKPISQPRLGCIAVYHRGSNPASGHVGFFVGRSGGRDRILGGNQSNAVNISGYSVSKLAGYRWPG